jgi:Leucine-rich repeat (LRR) protein
MFKRVDADRAAVGEVTLPTNTLSTYGNHTMRRKLLSVLVLSILVASTLVSCGSSPSTVTILTATEGNVSLMKAGTVGWVEAQVGMSLETGDSIKTADNSSAEITFFDGSTIELQSGTEMEIASLDISTDTGSTSVTLQQTIGTTVSRVTKLVDPASRYEVETPTGVVAVRGTVVQVYVTEDGTTWVAVLEGEARVTGEGVEVQIAEGQQCVVRPDESPELILEVAFADPDLEAAVRDAIAISTGPIYSSDLGELTDLDASAKNITDLTGLEYATGLTTLNLMSNQISDISPLADLTSLTIVNLWFNQIIDISPLANLTSLTDLYLVNNQISDISPLTGLTSLTGLWLNDNQITDLSALGDLTNLTGLGLNRNQVADVSPLAGLTNLTLGLWLSHNQLSDISALTNLTSLAILELADNEIGDISPLADLTSLTELYLGSNQVSDISPLASLNSLTILELGHNGINQISPLADLTNLTELYLWDNEISDMSPLVQNAGLGAGDTVDLRLNPLSSDSVTIYIPQLQERGVTVNY